MGSILITSFYAAILAVLLVALSIRIVVVVRGKGNISLGDGGNPQHNVAIRGQANFIEYVPLAVLVIAFAEFNGTASWLIHAMGIALVGARLVHPFGLRPEPGPTRRSG